jgi:hypothetical protein
MKMNPMENNEHIIHRLDKIDIKLNNIDKTLIKQFLTLEEHIKRTNALEEKINPIERFYIKIVGVVGFLTIVGVIATIVDVLIRFGPRK